MPRPRTNDPLGVSDEPENVVTAPARVNAMTGEFRRKLAFVERTYRATSRALGSDRDYNRSLEKLNRSLSRKRPSKRRGERAHPEVEIVILKHAMDHATARTGKPGGRLTQEDANAGARKAAELLHPRPGRSRNSLLRHYVKGLMALIQELTGRPVLLTLQKDHLYDPQAVNTGGRVLVMLAQQLEPAATVSTIASIVKQARREYAGKSMRFADFFPNYGVDLIAPERSNPLGANHQVVMVLPICAIYFP